MKIGLYGGSFDPIHRGHLDPIRAARRALGLDRVVYLPTGRPPHKPDRRFAPAAARHAMVEMALLHEEGLYASAFELAEDRPSYTVETVEHFRRAWPGAELFVIVGSDSFAELDTWRRWRDLIELARFAVLARPGHGLDEALAGLAPELLELLESGRARQIDNPPVDVSSTELRRLCAAGRELPGDKVPKLVIDYVVKYGLYRKNDGAPAGAQD